MKINAKERRTPYLNFLFMSIKQFFTNLIILIPTLWGILLFTGLVLGIFIQLLIFSFINGSVNLIKPNLLITITNFGIWGIFIVINAILIVSVYPYIMGMTIGLTYEIVNKGKANRKNMFLYGKLFLSKYLMYIIIETSICWIIYFLLLWTFQSINPFKIYQFILFLLISGIIYYSIFLLFFFIEPIMVQNKNSSFSNILVSSFKYIRKRTGHLLATSVIVIFTTLAPCFAILIFSRESLALIENIFIIFYYLSFFYINRIFIFHCYFFKNPIDQA